MVSLPLLLTAAITMESTSIQMGSCRGVNLTSSTKYNELSRAMREHQRLTCCSEVDAEQTDIPAVRHWLVCSHESTARSKSETNFRGITYLWTSVISVLLLRAVHESAMPNQMSSCNSPCLISSLCQSHTWTSTLDRAAKEKL